MSMEKYLRNLLELAEAGWTKSQLQCLDLINEVAKLEAKNVALLDELRRERDDNANLRRMREAGFAEFRKEVAARSAAEDDARELRRQREEYRKELGARFAAEDELRTTRAQLEAANAEGDKLRAEVTTLGHSWLATRVTLGRLRMRLQRALEDRK